VGTKTERQIISFKRGVKMKKFLIVTAFISYSKRQRVEREEKKRKF